MKILMVIPYISDIYGGPSRVAKNLAEAIAHQGISIDLISTTADGSAKLSVETEEWIEESDYRLRYFDCFHRNDFVVSIDLMGWVAKHLKDYDVVHTHNVFSPMMLAVRWLCDLRKIPCVVTPHGMLEPWALSYKSSKKKLYYQYLEAPSLKQAGAIHVLNQQESDNIQDLGLSQLEVLPNGIRQVEFEQQFDSTLFYERFPATQGKALILFLSRIDPKKGLDLLIPVFNQIHQEFPNSHLVIAGPDSIDYLATVKGFIESEGCQDHVTVTGMLTGDLKYSALAAANIYILPSYSEGFSMSVLEGMATGLPCVITTACNFPEAGDAGVAKVVDVDKTAIANALRELLADLSQAQAMGEAAKEFVFQNYTWDKIATKLIAVYESLLSPKTN